MQNTEGDHIVVFSQGGPILFAILPIVHLALCYAVGKYAEGRGGSFWLGTLLSFFVSPLIGFLIVLLVTGSNKSQIAP